MLLLKRKVLPLLLVTCFLVSTVQCSYVKAKTIEIKIKQEAITDVLVGGGIATETVLGWLLNALGFTAASKAVYDSRDSLLEWTNAIKDDLIQVAQERYTDLEISATSFEQWLKQVANGTLDKTSDCWQALKRYLTEAKTGDVSSSTSNILEVHNIKEYIQESVKNYNEIFVDRRIQKIDGSKLNLSPYEVTYQQTGCYQDGVEWKLGTDVRKFTTCRTSYTAASKPENNPWQLVKFIFSEGSEHGFARYGMYVIAVNPYYSATNLIPWCADNDSRQDVYWGNMNNAVEYCVSYVGNIGGMFSQADTYNTGGFSVDCGFQDVFAGLDNSEIANILGGIACGLITGYDGWNLGIKNPVSNPAKDVADSIAVAPETQEILDRDKTLDNVDVVTELDIPADDAIPVDLTGVAVGELAVPYTDAVPNTDTVDVAKDVTLPDKTPTKEKAKTKPKNRTGEFTLSGLQEVFPFCVPWDLKALGSTLAADAKAPKFTVKLPSGMNKKGVVYTEVVVDLKQFDDVAKILRVMELLLFCIGLVFVTRYLIKG